MEKRIMISPFHGLYLDCFYYDAMYDLRRMRDQPELPRMDASEVRRIANENRREFLQKGKKYERC